MSKPVVERGITPTGTAIWTDHLYAPDTRFTGDDDAKAKFVGTMTFDQGDEASEAWVQKRIERHEECWNGKGESFCPVTNGDEQTRKATEEDVKAKVKNIKGKAAKEGDPVNDTRYDGKWIVKFKTSKMPGIFDAFKQKVNQDDAKVMGGDTVRFAFSENPRDEGKITGCFLYLDGVQLIAKNNAGFNAADRFDVVDDGYAVPTSSDDSEETNNGAQGGDF